MNSIIQLFIKWFSQSSGCTYQILTVKTTIINLSLILLPSSYQYFKLIEYSKPST